MSNFKSTQPGDGRGAIGNAGGLRGELDAAAFGLVLVGISCKVLLI